MASNDSCDIDFKDFMKLFKECTKKSYSFLMNDTALPSDNPLKFRKNLLQKWVLVRKSKQSITKLSKTKLKKIDKLLRFLLYHQEMLVKMNFWLPKLFTSKRRGRKSCYNEKICLFTIIWQIIESANWHYKKTILKTRLISIMSLIK